MKRYFASGLFLLLSFSILSAFAQNTNVPFKYISPKPGSKYVMPQNNIVLREGEAFEMENLSSLQLDVEGSISGRIPGRLHFSDDNRSLIFLPANAYAPGEEITVSYSGGLKTLSGKIMSPVQFNFYVSKKIPLFAPDDYLREEFDGSPGKKAPVYQPKNKAVTINNLPDDFPEITVEVSNNPQSDEYYFISPFGYWGWFPDAIPYLIIMDARGTPVFYKRLDGHGYNFRVQQNGYLSFLYNHWPTPYTAIYDSSYHEIDTFTMQNGYSTDFHEFHLLPNGHAIIQGYDKQFVDMSQIVPGGDPNAQVTGWIIQEQDENKNVVFQWRSWDHFDITDADEHVDLTAATFDPIHGNSIDVVDNNTLLISPRNFNEMTKIDRNTGDIIWRLGGKQNMFEFINDSMHFSRAHHGRILGNGNLSLFDNGTYHPEPTFSSTLEYALDEPNLKATLVNRFRNNPDILGIIMGCAQHKDDGHIVTGWGSGVPGLTEFDAQGNTVLQIYFAGINYRAYRFPWTSTAFSLGDDSLHFGYTWYQQPVMKKIRVYNYQEEDLTITSAFLPGNDFSVNTTFPFTVAAGDSAWIQIAFNPSEAGFFEDVVTINSDINNDTLVQRIAQQVHVLGYATQGQSVDETIPGLNAFYPNPVEDKLNLNFKQGTPAQSLDLVNAQGQRIKHLFFEHPLKEQINMSAYRPGIYFLISTDMSNGKVSGIRLIKK